MQVLGEEKAEGKHLRSVLKSVGGKTLRSFRCMALVYVWLQIRAGTVLQYFHIQCVA